MGARHRERAAKDEANGIGDYFKDDNPPRVGCFNASLFGFLGVFNNLLNLFVREFDFHGSLGLVFAGKDIKKKFPNGESWKTFLRK